MSDALDLLKVGVWQDAGSQPSNVLLNLQIIKNAAKAAEEQAVDILTFPECFLTGYYQDVDTEQIAKCVDQSIVEELERISREFSVALVIGTYEFFNERIYNAAFFVSPSMGLIGTYRKRALYGGWEQKEFSRGNTPLVLEYQGWKIGFLICFDVEFPELARETAELGADIIIVPTSLMEPYNKVATHLVPTRAIENQLYIVYANRIGNEQEYSYVGQSSICGPDGTTQVAGSQNKAEMLTSDVNLSTIAKVREPFCYLKDVKQVFLTKIRPQYGS